MSDRRAYEAEWEQQPGYSAPAPLSDPIASTRLIPANKDTGRAYPHYDGIVGGKVIEAMGFLRTYRVAIDNGPIIQCTDLRHKTMLPWGPSDISTYSSGDEVLVYLQSSVTYGVILGAVSPPVQEPLDYRPDTIHAGSNVGYFVDGTCNYWADLSSNDMIDFSSGRPIDATAGPEAGQQGLTGVGFFNDDFLAMMKVDEATGVFGFYDDSLLRVSGRNLQIRGSGLEYEHLNDEGEISSYRGITPYVWEAQGVFKPGVKASGDILDAAEVSTTTEEPTSIPPEGIDESSTTGEPDGETTTGEPTTESPELEGIRHGFIQPMAYDQMAFHRSVQWEGYLGQGGRDTILVPGPDVKGKEDSLINTYSEDLRLASVFAAQKSLVGKLTMVSSGGFLFVKRPPLPAPKRKERPESPLGDLNTAVATYRKNYDACGLPEEEQVTTDEPTTGEPGTTTEPTTEAPYVARSTHFVVAEIPFEDATTLDPSGSTSEEPTTEEPTTVEGETTTIDPASLTVESVPESVVRLAMLADEMAYTLAWEGLHAFHYHNKDFYLPQESDLAEINRSPAAEYAALAKYQYLGEDPERDYPEKVKIRVDHKYGEVNIYLNTAVFGLRSDGSVVMQSGCGCGMSTLNGTLEFTAPGDIVMRPGRNLVAWSGHDAILKARNSIDLSATENDIRMVAGGNLMAASAVGGTGAMLFQSFSTCIIDPEKSNQVEEPTTTIDPNESDQEPPVETTTEAPDEPTKAPTYFLGEEVVGSGILFKASRAQITLASEEANIEVGRKVYEDEGEDNENDPAPVNEDGVIEERKWSWKPGRCRIYAEGGDVELFGHYIVNYIGSAGSLSSEGHSDDPAGSSGAFMQVFVRRQQLATDEDDTPPLEPNDLPPNVLAAAGTADLSGNNSCGETEAAVCYTVDSVNEFRYDRANFCSQVLINTELFVGGCAYVRGNIVAFDHIESNYNLEQFNGGLFTQREDVVDTFNEADTRCRQLLPPLTAELVGRFVSAVSGSWLDYSCRTPDQYGTAQAYCIMETNWQHQIRVAAEAAAYEDPDPDNPPPPLDAPEYSFNFYPDLPEGLTYWSEMSTIVDYANKKRTAPYPGIDYVRYEAPTTEAPEETTSGEPGSTEEPTTAAPEDENPPRLAKRAYGVYHLSMVDEIEGRPIDRDETYQLTTLEGGEEGEEGEEEGEGGEPVTGAIIYESPTLRRSVKRELGHYIVVDVLGTTTTTTTTTTEEPEE